MAVELHLPDLPEVPIVLGASAEAPSAAVAASGAAQRRGVPWLARLRDTLSAYSPMLLMAALALFTWWLVKNTPPPAPPQDAVTVRHDPDYTMTQFALQRFGADGRLTVRVEGALMRHFPDTDRIEIDNVQLRAISPDGRVTLASARRAVSNGDASQVQLIGDAHVTSVDAGGTPIVMQGEFLHAFLVAEQVRSHLPVQVTTSGARLTAAGLAYDHGARKLELKGPVHAVFAPPASTTRR